MLVCLFAVSSVVANTTGPPPSTGPKMQPIADIVVGRFDGKGFSDNTGEASTLNSTVSALELLNETGALRPGLFKDQFDAITKNILALQDDGGGFRITPDADRPDIQTTALSVKALILMGRLDQHTRVQAIRYLSNYFYGGLTLDNWLTDGIFSVKYWGLVCASELDCLSVIGLQPLTLNETVFLSQVTGAQINGDLRPVIEWGKLHFANPVTGSDPFNQDMDLQQRLMVLQSFDILVAKDEEKPTLIGLLVNCSKTTDDLEAEYVPSAGLFRADPVHSETAFRALKMIGKMNKVLAIDVGFQRLDAVRGRIAKTLNTASMTAWGNASVSEMLSMLRISRTVPDKLSGSYIAFTPMSLDGNTVSGWQATNVTDYLLVRVEPDLATRADRSGALVFLILCSSVIGIGFVLAVTKRSMLMVILSIVFILMFMSDIFASLTMVAQSVPEGTISLSQVFDDPFFDMLTLISRLPGMMAWTSYIVTRNQEASASDELGSQVPQGTGGTIAPVNSYLPSVLTIDKAPTSALIDILPWMSDLMRQQAYQSTQRPVVCYS